jgi:hypothetical protein
MLYTKSYSIYFFFKQIVSNEGLWRDEVDPAHPVYTGPIWLEAYPAPLQTLPYFTRAGPLQWLDTPLPS